MKHIPELTEKDLKRFWSKIQVLDEDSCWPWLGGKTKDGYGLFSICRLNEDKKYYVHRISLSIKDNNQQVVCRHSCDNPTCCNPHHLSWGTHQDNSDDMVSRNRQGRNGGSDGTHNRGTDNHNHKFGESDIIEIRRMYETGYNMSQIANAYQVHKTCIQKIVRRLSWKHIP